MKYPWCYPDVIGGFSTKIGFCTYTSKNKLYVFQEKNDQYILLTTIKDWNYEKLKSYLSFSGEQLSFNL